MLHSPAPKVLIADDDPDLLRMLDSELSDCGYEVHCARSSEEFRAAIELESFDVALLDLHIGDDHGLDLLGDLQTAKFCAPVIVLAAQSSIELAVRAMRLGAHDFVVKPPDIPRLGQTLREAIAERRLQQPTRAIADPTDPASGDLPMLGISRKMQALRQLIAEAAPSNATVLILGESGTGKELIAKAIHQQSGYSEGRFVPVNMAALPASLAESMLFGHERGSFTGADAYRPGWCEQADRGTLFLDEIGDMDIALQAKLLRFLQQRQIQPIGSDAAKSIDVRIVAATNRDPLDLIRDGRLRDDLYYRLNVIPIEAPPLRERPEDISLLAMYFLRRTAAENGKPAPSITPEALVILESYDWPGNVRQLENLIQRLVILAPEPEISPEMLPAELLAHVPGPSARSACEPVYDDGLTVIDRLEKQAIRDALDNCEGNVVRAGNLLGMGQATIYRKIKRYDIALKRRRASRVNKA